ncbi:T9SS-dependent choice-of-anchor J family protein [Pontibacter sp. G13]|uniref:T9SS-dependent choice-of-anchor J family protein n=1 Tax=Pontibacter sp. G13 TaxID=3074898 RepID=UPI002889F853|nr:choice-of-anchor J domain-containing protein [Pontibacter sp. G13]WNJ17593.1 choice-of-anchor J domain-containing protein [Pontibacter sp. G13]
MTDLRKTCLGLLGLLLSCTTIFAQSPSRSGNPAEQISKASLRQFPCGGLTVFEENFDSTAIPAGWTVLDLDGLAPDSNLNPITPNPGWQSIEDLMDPMNGQNRSIASPSFYQDTVGRSDDWIITPQIQNLPANVCLSWLAYSQDADFNEDYQVLISTTLPEPDSFFANSNLASVFSEKSELNYRSVSLADYEGEDVYIAFRQVTTDGFLLVLDDIRLAEVEEIDMAMFQVDPISAPINQEITISGSFINRGLVELEFDSAEFSVFYRIDGGDIEEQTIDIEFELIPNDTLTFVHDSTWTPTEERQYLVEVWIDTVSGDMNPENDTLRFMQAIGGATSLNPGFDLPVSIYPNPVESSLIVHIPNAPESPLDFRVLDAQGRMVIAKQRIPMGMETLKLDLGHLPNGFYFLEIQQGDRTRALEKFIKQ